MIDGERATGRRASSPGIPHVQMSVVDSLSVEATTGVLASDELWTVAPDLVLVTSKTTII